MSVSTKENNASTCSTTESKSFPILYKKMMLILFFFGKQ